VEHALFDEGAVLEWDEAEGGGAGEGNWMEEDPNVEKDDVGSFDIWSAFGPGTGFGPGGGGEPNRVMVIDENAIEEIGGEDEVEEVKEGKEDKEEKGGDPITCVLVDEPGNAPIQQAARAAIRNRGATIIDHVTVMERK
jgi:hypothetical protein